MVSDINILRFFLFGSFFLLFGCEKEEDNQAFFSETSDQQAMSLSSITDFLVASEGLGLSRFTDDGTDETADFADYIFHFQLDGQITATKGQQSILGTYRLFRDDAKLELALSFPSSPDFRDLNDDWYFFSLDQNRIRFEDAGDILEFQNQNQN